MNRRGFLATIAGALLAPLVPKAAPIVPSAGAKEPAGKSDYHVYEYTVGGCVGEYGSFPRVLNASELHQLNEYMRCWYMPAITL